jgi:cytochrome o ubiquinol oxidase operon protein cyoD
MSAKSQQTHSEYDYAAGSYVGEDRPRGAAPDVEAHPLRRELGGYLLGFALAVGLTVASFWVSGTKLIYGPSLAVALLVLAVAQMGIHLIFFLHITTDPDNTNNVMALAFGVLIVCLVVFGSIWVMTHLNENMMTTSMDQVMRMQM